MTEFEDTLEATVDFNSLDEDGLLVAALRHFRSFRVPRIGEMVWLRDSEGNSCWGSVVRVSERVMRLRLDRATWVHGDVPEQQTSSSVETAWHHGDPASLGLERVA